MSRKFLMLAVGLLAFASAGQAGELYGDLQACRTLGDGPRLACFDRVLASHDAPPPPVAKPDFGSERLPQAADAAKEPDSMQDRVVKVSFNAFKQFTVTLANGQVWRQLDSDTAVARFAADATVKITRGFLDSYSLSVEGVWGAYKVKRIK